MENSGSDDSHGNRVRLKTNVIDYRPITAPLASPRIFSRPSSPTSIKSPKFPKEEIYRSILEKAEFDMDKLMENLPTYLRDDRSNNNSHYRRDRDTTPISFIKSVFGGGGGAGSGGGTGGRKTAARNISNNGLITGTASNSNYSSLLAPRPLSRGPSSNFSGASTPSSSRREENSLDLHTKRIGFHMTPSGKSFPNCNNYSSSMSSNKSPGSVVTTKKPWRTSGGVSVSVPSTPTTASANSHRLKRDEMMSNSSSPKPMIRSGPVIKKLATLPKRPCTTIDSEKENPCPPTSKKDVFLKHVYVVNGSVVAFKSFGYDNFTNWFGDETMLSKDKKQFDFFHRELDVWGFTNREITMKLFCGNKLMIEANRPARGKLPPKKFKETIILPNHLSVESLVVCRVRSGRLIIQEHSSSYLPSSHN